MLITQKLFWDKPVHLNGLARSELEFWFRSVFSLPPHVNSPWLREPERIIYTDASDHAGAGVMLGSVNQTFHCTWDDFTKLQSSTNRELKAVDLVLLTF